MIRDKSKTILTRHGRKGESISFDLEKRNEFINGFITRKKERRERSSLKKKLKERKFIKNVKKDAKETIQRHVKTISQVCRQDGELKSSPGKDGISFVKRLDLESGFENEAEGTTARIVRYDGKTRTETKGSSNKDNGASEHDECQPWSMPCSVKITQSI
ncbi:hypothetical protein FG386_002196 [Cryptosporidium ryanae]|uniref:uncharacterized protein n=1 Tax=Cryptosporidium ryanae TaxID=515981 RepID=UPI00351A939E|nr:hypothetical protein FG386_002196 [Cryptosporidium ryanae]